MSMVKEAALEAAKCTLLTWELCHLTSNQILVNLQVGPEPLEWAAAKLC